MPIRCVAGGCSNTYKEGVSFFNFPKERPRRRIWISKVQTTRAKWTPTEHSKLCSAHFTDDCFETEVALASSMGINRRKRLRPTAVPSLFSSQTRKRTRDSDNTNSHKPTKRLRRAYEKRERSQVRIVHIYTCTQLIKQ